MLRALPGVTWALVLLAGVSSLALAQERQATPAAAFEEARRQFVEGVALAERGNFRGAMAKFERSYELRPAAGVLYNLGRAQHRLNLYVEAIDSFRRYLEGSPGLAPDRQAVVRQLLAEMERSLVTVELEGLPAGGTVHIDGRPHRWRPVRLPPGRYVLELNAPGFQRQQRDLRLETGGPQRLAIRLEPSPTGARLRIVPEPRQAEVRIDGRVAGRGVVELELPAGGHSIEVAAGGHQLLRTQVALEAGQSRSLELALLPADRPFYRRWWFWTVVGVVVAGGATAGAVVGTRGGLPMVPGSLPPGVQQIR